MKNLIKHCIEPVLVKVCSGTSAAATHRAGIQLPTVGELTKTCWHLTKIQLIQVQQRLAHAAKISNITWSLLKWKTVHTLDLAIPLSVYDLVLPSTAIYTCTFIRTHRLSETSLLVITLPELSPLQVKVYSIQRHLCFLFRANITALCLTFHNATNLGTWSTTYLFIPWPYLPKIMVTQFRFNVLTSIRCNERHFKEVISEEIQCFFDPSNSRCRLDSRARRGIHEVMGLLWHWRSAKSLAIDPVSLFVQFNIISLLYRKRTQLYRMWETKPWQQFFTELTLKTENIQSTVSIVEYVDEKDSMPNFIWEYSQHMQVKSTLLPGCLGVCMCYVWPGSWSNRPNIYFVEKDSNSEETNKNFASIAQYCITINCQGIYTESQGQAHLSMT